MRENAGEFKLVTRRKKRTFRARVKCDTNESFPVDSDSDRNDSTSYETLVGRLHEAEVELQDSAYADNVFYHLNDSLIALDASGISDILCYGLGRFSRNKPSVYQLALLLLLKKRYESHARIYDPVFSSMERKFLKRCDFDIIETNEEGKRVIGDGLTLVYMPHCSTHLVNNFLYANWCTNLSKCILLTNSFSIVLEHTRETNKPVETDYVQRVGPFVTEIVLTNNFRYEEAFNDLSIHIFLERDVGKLAPSFWNEREEPCYGSTERDYLTAKETEGKRGSNDATTCVGRS